MRLVQIFQTSMDRHYERYELLRPLVGYFKHINDPGLLKFMLHIRGLNLHLYEKTYDFRVWNRNFHQIGVRFLTRSSGRSMLGCMDGQSVVIRAEMGGKVRMLFVGPDHQLTKHRSLGNLLYSIW
jgi:hypothetical protein